MKRLGVILALLSVAASPPMPPSFKPALYSPKDERNGTFAAPQVIMPPNVPIYTITFTNDVISTNLLIAVVQKSGSPTGPWTTFMPVQFTNYFMFDLTNPPDSGFFRLVSP